VAKESTYFQLTVNIVALMVNFTSACLTGSTPLMVVQLLWVNMIMDTLGTLTLATEPPNDALMKRTLVGRQGNFISNVMWRNIFGQSLYQFVVIWLLQAKGKSFYGLYGYDSDLILNTLIFNSFVYSQLFNEVKSREMDKIDVLNGIWINNVFVSVCGATMVFQVIIIEFLVEVLFQFAYLVFKSFALGDSERNSGEWHWWMEVVGDGGGEGGKSLILYY
ncbi:putative calcium-transporting ATPase, partial [Tanacetum coccineum]